MATPTALPSRVCAANTSAAAGQTYYVDAAIGSDSNTAAQAKSTATPWATVQHALDSGIAIPTLGSNTPVQLYIRGTDGSTTRGFTITDTGPSSAVPAGFTNSGAIYQPARDLVFPVDSPLLISNYPGERVLIGFTMKHSKNDTYVCWRGQDVSGKKGMVFDSRFPGGATTNIAGWYCLGSTHIELYNCEVRNNVWNASGGGVYVGAFSFGGTDRAATDIQIINNYIHHNGGQNVGSHGIYFGGTAGTQLIGAVGGAVYNNLIVFNYSDNLCPHNAPQGTVFAHNTLVGWGGGGASGGTATSPVTGDGNHQSYTDGSTVFAPASSTDPMTKDCIWVNNIMANNFGWGLNFFDSTLTSGNGATGNVEKNNVYYGNGSGSVRDAGGALTQSSTLTSNNPLFTNFSSTNPASDFTLTGSSPCIGAAAAAFMPTFDYNGATRVTNDVGPFAISGGAVVVVHERSLLGVGS